MNGTASLGTEHGGALNNHFLQASGDYILNAPSGGDDAVYQNGIWWLIPEAGPGPSLDLLALPAGWVYEGWVVGPDGPMTTGRFTDLSGADSDGAGPTAGMGDFPPFPGQDFVNPAVDLIGYAAVISIEPEPDTSAAPFDLKPLLDSSIDDVGAGTPQAMMNNAETFPTGTATLVGMAADAGAETMEETETEAEPTILPASGAARLPATLVGGAVALVAGALLLGAGWIARKRSQ